MTQSDSFVRLVFRMRRLATGYGSRASDRAHVPWQRTCGAVLLRCALSLIVLWLWVGLGAAADNHRANRKKLAKRVPAKLSVHDAVNIAVVRNLQITSKRLALRQEEHKSRAAFSDFFPSLSLDYEAVADKYQQIGNIEDFAMAHDSRWQFRFVHGPPFLLQPEYPYRIDPYRSFTLTATLTQPIFTGGELINRYKYRRLGVQGAQLDIETVKQDIALNVYVAYFQLVLGKKLLQVADESIKDLKAFRYRAQSFYKAGEALKVDVMAAEGQLAQARVSRERALTSIDTARSKLNFLLRYPQGSPVRVDDEIRSVPFPYRIPAIYRMAVANRPEIKRADISTAQAAALVKVSEAGLMPTAELEIEGYRMNDDWNVFDREAMNEWSVKGILTWTFDMFRSRETVNERRASRVQTAVDKQYLVQQILQQVHLAYLQVKNAQADVHEISKAVQWRKAQYAMVKELYDQQLATYIQLLDAQTNMDQAKASHFSAQAKYRTSLAELEREIGILR